MLALLPLAMVWRRRSSVCLFCSLVQDKGLDTEGKFREWWRYNVDPDAMAEKLSSMKARSDHQASISQSAVLRARSRETNMQEPRSMLASHGVEQTSTGGMACTS